MVESSLAIAATSFLNSLGWIFHHLAVQHAGLQWLHHAARHKAAPSCKMEEGLWNKAIDLKSNKNKKIKKITIKQEFQ